MMQLVVAVPVLVPVVFTVYVAVRESIYVLQNKGKEYFYGYWNGSQLKCHKKDLCNAIQLHQMVNGKKILQKCNNMNNLLTNFKNTITTKHDNYAIHHRIKQDLP